MKQLLVLLFLLWTALLRAQTAEEWTAQKKTGLRYQAEQIAALKTWSRTLAKGYETARAGLNLLSDSKNQDFFLHRQHFASLTCVSPAVKGYARVVDIISLQKGILRLCRKSVGEAKKCAAFSAEERAWLGSICNQVLDACASDLSLLGGFLSDGVYAIPDDQRLKRIDALYAALQERFSLAREIARDVGMLAAGRERERKDAAAVRSLYGLH